MFRKIHSKRDPGDTLWREIRKEFSVYFAQADASANSFLARYPKQVFAAMALLMLVSLVLSFTVFRKPAEVVKEGKNKPPVNAGQPEASRGTMEPLTNGFSQILQTTSAIQETMALRKEIEILLAKKQLSPLDSAALTKALDRLGQISHQINPKQ